MKYLIFLIPTVISVFLVTCSSPSDSNTGNKPTIKNNFYYPLEIGNSWYYNSYHVSQPLDLTTFDQMWLVISQKYLGEKKFYGIKRTYYDPDTTVIHSIDTIYLCLHGDSLFQILPNLSFSESSVSLQAILSDTGYITFTMDWYGYAYESQLVNRTDTTITLSYWMPGWMDSGSEKTFKKGVGFYDSNSGWGLGTRLVKFSLKSI